LVDWTPMEARSMVSARSSGVIHSGAPNDVIQALLVAARSADLIDGVVMLDMDRYTLQPVARVASTVHEIVNSVGMQYLWAPVLSVLNEAIFECNRDRPLEEVVADFTASFLQIQAAIQDISEEDLFAHDRFPWTGNLTLADYAAGNTCNHYAWANAQIRKWISCSRSQHRNASVKSEGR